MLIDRVSGIECEWWLSLTIDGEGFVAVINLGWAIELARIGLAESSNS